MVVPYKDPERQRAAVRQHYERHQAVYAERRQRARRDREGVVREAKAGRSCADCGESYPPGIMAFHHRPGVEKIGEVSYLVRTRGRQVVLDEIAKCELLCLNCHGLRHL